MKCYCVLPAADQVDIPQKIIPWREGARYDLEQADCNKCKHKMTCLLDPEGYRIFESK